MRNVQRTGLNKWGRGVAFLACVFAGTACDASFDLTTTSSSSQEELPAVEPAAPVAPAPAPNVGLPLPQAVQVTGGAPQSFADLAALADPGVVFVRTVQSQRIGLRRVLADGSGSGFVFDSSGLILTNYHVVQGAEAIAVELFDGRAFPAQVVGADPLTDIAVLRVQAQELPVLPLGDSDQVRVGDWVLAIGNPFGLEHTVSAGIISAKERTGQDVDLRNPRAYYSFLQTDASINPGNSGGPLIDLRGQVIGINTAINRDANSIGFAIPINMVRELLPRLLKDGVIQRAAIGVEVAELSGSLSEGGRGPRSKGALVVRVAAGSPAERGGLQAGDVILQLGGRPIENPERLRWWASLAPIGEPVEIVVQRGDQRVTLSVVPARLRY